LAVLVGNTPLLGVLLRYRPDLEVRTEGSQRSAAHLAAAFARNECLALLLECGADAEARDAKGHTPLHLAALSDDDKCIARLLERGVAVDARNARQRTPLHLAALRGNEHALRALIEASADVNLVDESGLSPLHLAAGQGQIGAVDMLLKAHADPNLPDRWGRSAFHLAALAPDSELLSLLYRAGARPSLLDCSGHSPLHLLAAQNEPTIFDLLLQDARSGEANEEDEEEGAAATPRGTPRVPIPADPSGRTPLHYAAAHLALDCVEVLIDSMNEHDVNLQDLEGRTALHVTALVDAPGEQVLPVMDVLLEKADPHLRDRSGATALDLVRGRADATWEPVLRALEQAHDGTSHLLVTFSSFSLSLFLSLSLFS
jgi:ankyrin repeat protein